MHEPDKHGTLIDKYGDALLSGYKAKGDNEYNTLHNSLCRMASTCASQAHIHNKLEGGKVRGTKKRPGDVRFSGDSGSHGWTAAGSRELWVDVTVVCPVLPTYVRAAAAERGAASPVSSTSCRWLLKPRTWRSCCWASPSSVLQPSCWTALQPSSARGSGPTLAQPFRHDARAPGSALREGVPEGQKH